MTADGQLQHPAHQRGWRVRGHRPAHQLAGKQVQHHGQIQPAAARADVRDISDPSLVGPCRIELPVEHNGRDRQGVLAVGGVGPGAGEQRDVKPVVGQQLAVSVNGPTRHLDGVIQGGARGEAAGQIGGHHAVGRTIVRVQGKSRSHVTCLHGQPACFKCCAACPSPCRRVDAERHQPRVAILIHPVQLERLFGNVDGNDSEPHGGSSGSVVESPLNVCTLRPLTEGGAHTRPSLTLLPVAPRSDSASYLPDRSSQTLAQLSLSAQLMWARDQRTDLCEMESLSPCCMSIKPIQDDPPERHIWTAEWPEKNQRSLNKNSNELVHVTRYRTNNSLT